MVQAWFDVGMEVQDIRRKRLRDLIAEMADGNITAFAGKVKKSPSQINDMLASRKPFGEKVARDLERRCRKPEDWLDHEHDADAADGSEPAARLDGDTLHTAIQNVEQVLHDLRVSATPEARAEITMAMYDLLREGQDMQAAARVVSRMLRAMGGVRPVHTE